MGKAQCSFKFMVDLDLQLKVEPKSQTPPKFDSKVKLLLLHEAPAFWCSSLTY